MALLPGERASERASERGGLPPRALARQPVGGAPRGTSYRQFRSRSPRESAEHLKGLLIASSAFE